MNPRIDQAEQLRSMVARGPHAAAPPQPPAIVLVVGAKGGVGATTLAWRLGETIALRDATALVIDATFDRPDLAMVAGLRPGARPDSKPDLSEALAEGIGALPRAVLAVNPRLSLIPGGREFDRQGVTSERTTKLLAGVSLLQADYVLMDLGAGFHPGHKPLWQAAQMALVVTTPDGVSTVNTYAALKMAETAGLARPAAVVVNRCYQANEAEQAHQRLSEACGAHLGFTPPLAGWLPDVPRGSLRSPAVTAPLGSLANYVRYVVRGARPAAHPVSVRRAA